MAKVFTQEEREKIKGQVVELVRQSGRETLRQLETKTGATRYLMSVLARTLIRYLVAPVLVSSCRNVSRPLWRTSSTTCPLIFSRSSCVKTFATSPPENYLMTRN